MSPVTCRMNSTTDNRDVIFSRRLFVMARQIALLVPFSATPRVAARRTSHARRRSPRRASRRTCSRARATCSRCRPGTGRTGSARRGSSRGDRSPTPMRSRRGARAAATGSSAPTAGSSRTPPIGASPRLQRQLAGQHRLHDLLVRHGLARHLLVRELWPGRGALAHPDLGIALRVELRTARPLQAGAPAAVQRLVLRLGGVAERLLRRDAAATRLSDVLPPELRELGVVGDVETGRRPVLDARAAEELDEAAPLVALGIVERGVIDAALAD